MIDAVVDSHYEIHGSAVKGDLHGSLYAAGRNSVLQSKASEGAHAIPLGYTLAPVEPTDEMLEAGRPGRVSPELGGDFGKNWASTVYKSMLAAAPKPPEPKP